MPNEKMSDWASASLPDACSGDMYATVPRTVPAIVSSSRGSGCSVFRGS